MIRKLILTVAVMTLVMLMSSVAAHAQTVDDIDSFIIGYWTSIGEYGFGQAQPGYVVWFDGENACFYSPMDTYSIEQSGDRYTLYCRNWLWGDTLSFGLEVLDEDNVRINFGGTSSDYTYLTRSDENGAYLGTPYGGDMSAHGSSQSSGDAAAAEEGSSDEDDGDGDGEEDDAAIDEKRNKPSVLLTGPGKKDYIDFGENLDGYIDRLTDNRSPSDYHPDLAYLCIALCNAVYDEGTIREDIDRLGFMAKGTWGYTDDSPISYAIGIKAYDDRPQEVLIVIKGTENNEEIKTDLNKGAGILSWPHWHEGFEKSANEVFDTIQNTVTDPKNAKFVITGFSLGAATANLVSVKLSDMGAPKGNVFDYNFACPDVAVGQGMGWNFMNQHDNIYNLGHCKDLITVVPGQLCNIIDGNSVNQWGKFGRSLWFSKDWNNASETQVDLAIWNFTYHNQSKYLEYFKTHRDRGMDQFKGYDDWKRKSLANDIGAAAGALGIGVHCPVDVTVRDEYGVEMASVIGGEVIYGPGYEDSVWAVTDGENKAFVVPVRDIEVDITGTGSGTMDYYLYNMYSPDEPEVLAKYTDLEVETGMEYIATVTDAAGELQADIAPASATGTEKPEVSQRKPHKALKVILIIIGIIVAVLAAIFIIDNIRYKARHKKKKSTTSSKKNNRSSSGKRDRRRR